MRKLPKMSKERREDLLRAFRELCNALGKECKEFNYNDITKSGQWALAYRKNCGWLIVCGLGGCGCALTRFNGYIKGTWNMMIAMEMTTMAVRGGW